MTDNPFSDETLKPHPPETVLGSPEALIKIRRDRVLQQRINQLESIFDNLPEAVIVLDAHGSIVSANRHAIQLLGNLPLNLAPDRWPTELGFFLDDGETYYPGSRMPNMRALQGEEIASEEFVLKPAGAVRGIWISMSAKPITATDGQMNGAVIMFRDVTYRKQIEISREKHVQRAEALYRLSKTIAEVGDDVLQVMNTAVIHAAEMVGDACVAYLVNEKMDQIDFHAVYHPNPSSRALLREIMLSQSHQLDKSIAGGVVRSGEPLIIPSITPEQLAAISDAAFGKYTQVVGIESIIVVPLKGRSRVLGTLGLSRDWGRPSYSSDEQSFLEDIARRTALALENCTLTDSLRAQIHERLMAEKALRESEELFRSIFQSSALGIKVLDPEGRILYSNPAWQAILGYSVEEMVGKHFTHFIYPEDKNLSQQHIEALLSGGIEDTILDHRLCRKDGELVWVRSIFAGVKEVDDEETYRFIVAMVENITDRKQIASELLEMKARLMTGIEMERLRLAQELHDGPMQDLHSVLYQLQGMRNNLLSENKTSTDTILETIHQVINELRSTAKELRPPTLMEFGLEKAIRSHVEEFKDKHPDVNINLALTSDGQLLSEEIRLGLFRIYQASLVNIIRHAQAKNVNIRFTLDAEEVVLEIEDDGRGFVVPGRWITLTRQGHFGLAGAAERVEMLGGSFDVVSAPGKGTRLVIRIPGHDGMW